MDPIEQVLDSLQSMHEGELKPGDSGYRRHARFPMASSAFCPRQRVLLTSACCAAMDYVVRPESTVKEKVTGKPNQSKQSALQKKLAKKVSKHARAESVSIEGRALRM